MSIPEVALLRVATREYVWLPNDLQNPWACILQSFDLDYDSHSGNRAVYGRPADVLPALRSVWPNQRSVRLAYMLFAVNRKEDTAFVDNFDA